ncbi:MAG: hypothetical protein HYZ65_14750 [Burkholderiales bacterium]|nr:hypothetical protein [Burkholderiales bacterium]
MIDNKQAGAIHLAAVAILFMLLAAAAMTFLYSMRYGRLPMQDVWDRWGKSATAISAELKNAGGWHAEAGPVATVDGGIRRCQIHGKLVYSDNACNASNPSSREVRLQDSKGFEAPKAPPPGAAGEEAVEQELRSKLLEKLAK